MFGKYKDKILELNIEIDRLKKNDEKRYDNLKLLFFEKREHNIVLSKENKHLRIENNELKELIESLIK